MKYELRKRNKTVKLADNQTVGASFVRKTSSGMFVKGVRTVIDVAPRTNYRRHIKSTNIQGRLRTAVGRVGKNMNNAMNQFINEQQKKRA